ncbi:MAG: carboxyl transferase domain-containing protein [Candidatus Binatia bacterium]
MTDRERRPEAWRELLEERDARHTAAAAMGGEDKIARQHARGRLTARERITRLCDDDSFLEYGALVGSAHPGGDPAVPADALVGGTASIEARPVVVVAEDFTVKGGSIGHGNHAKRLRLASLARQERIPLVLMLDGAGERATNGLERYAYAPNDLQVIADLVGRVPVVTLILGTSAGHGALSGVFADLIVMARGAAVFAAGPPLVEAALGIRVEPEQLGGALMHTTESGVAHNLAADEDEAFDVARRFLAFLPSRAGLPAPRLDGPPTASRPITDIFEVIPRDSRRAYDMNEVISRTVDEGSMLEVQPLYGTSLITAFARLGGRSVLVVANQPQVMGGAITREAAEKATHFLGVARAFKLPVVFLADNPGVMAGPEAERAGTLRAAAHMYAAQRRVRGPKLHVTVRKAFGFGSSLMAMNPFDRQTVTLAFPGISLGGVPAFGGARAAGASEAEEQRMAESQDAAWTPADNGSYDRVIDPRELRNELIAALDLRRERDRS